MVAQRENWGGCNVDAGADTRSQSVSSSCSSYDSYDEEVCSGRMRR